MKKFKIEVSITGYVTAKSEKAALKWIEENAEVFFEESNKYIEGIEEVKKFPVM